MAELMSNIQAINLIAVNPEIRSGRAYIVDTTVTIADIVTVKHYHNLDVDEIADWYGLSLSQVYAALSYYYEHKAEVDQQVRIQIRHAETVREQKVGSRHLLLS